MGERFWGSICIGGDVPKWLVPRIHEMIIENFDPYEVDSTFEEGDDFHAGNSEASYGRFEELEEFLVRHRIFFDRSSDHYSEWDAGLVQYRGEDWTPTRDPLPERRTSADGSFIWGWGEIASAFEAALKSEDMPHRDTLARHLHSRDQEVDQLLGPILVGMGNALDAQGAETLKPLKFVDTCNVCGKGFNECEHVKAALAEDPKAFESWISDFIVETVRSAAERFIHETRPEEDMRAAGNQILAAWWDLKACEMNPRSGQVWTVGPDGHRRHVGKMLLEKTEYDGEHLKAVYMPATPVELVNLTVTLGEEESDGPPQD